MLMTHTHIGPGIFRRKAPQQRFDDALHLDAARAFHQQHVARLHEINKEIGGIRGRREKFGALARNSVPAPASLPRQEFAAGILVSPPAGWSWLAAPRGLNCKSR